DPIPWRPTGPCSSLGHPLGGHYTTSRLDLQSAAVDQWNVSYQRQIAADWMVSANYIGNMIKHLWTTNQIDPAVYAPGATTGNTQARRVLNLQNPDQGKYYASIQELDDN